LAKNYQQFLNLALLHICQENKILTPGVNVMVTNFSDFRRKNWRFFLKTNVIIQFLQNLAVLRVKKRQFFAVVLGEKSFKIMASVPALI
jgi:hypothetical protein